MSAMPGAETSERRIYRVYHVSIILKGLNALLEIVLGAGLLFSNFFNDFVYALLSNELIEDPNDFFASHLHSFLLANPKAQLVGGLYLLGNGIVKAIVVYGLLRKRAWGYPAALAVLSLFILYQAVRFVTHPSIPLLFLTGFDLVVITLIYHEYRLSVKTENV